MSEPFNFHHLLRLRSAVFSVIEASQRYKHLRSQNVCHHQIRIVLECVVWTPCLISQVRVRTKSILNTFCEMMSSGHASIFPWRRTNETLIESTENGSLIIDCDFSVFQRLVYHSYWIGKPFKKENVSDAKSSGDQIGLHRKSSSQKTARSPNSRCAFNCVYVSVSLSLLHTFSMISPLPHPPARQKSISTGYSSEVRISYLFCTIYRTSFPTDCKRSGDKW